MIRPGHDHPPQLRCQIQPTSKLSPIMKVLLIFLLAICASQAAPFKLEKDSRIVLLGNGLGSRLMQSGRFEASLHVLHPEKHLFIRNMCDEGSTPAVSYTHLTLPTIYSV